MAVCWIYSWVVLVVYFFDGMWPHSFWADVTHVGRWFRTIHGCKTYFSILERCLVLASFLSSWLPSVSSCCLIKLLYKICVSLPCSCWSSGISQAIGSLTFICWENAAVLSSLISVHVAPPPLFSLSLGIACILHILYSNHQHLCAWLLMPYVVYWN